MELITKDLSEPYSIYTYRYFIHNWPHLCILVSSRRRMSSILIFSVCSDYNQQVFASNARIAPEIFPPCGEKKTVCTHLPPFLHLCSKSKMRLNFARIRELPPQLSIVRNLRSIERKTPVSLAKFAVAPCANSVSLRFGVQHMATRARGIACQHFQGCGLAVQLVFRLHQLLWMWEGLTIIHSSLPRYLFF